MSYKKKPAKKKTKSVIEMDPIIPQHRPDLKESADQWKIDTLIRLGLGDANHLAFYRQVFADPQYAVQSGTLRRYVALALHHLSDIVLNDSILYNRVRLLLEQRKPKLSETLEEGRFAADPGHYVVHEYTRETLGGPFPSKGQALTAWRKHLNGTVVYHDGKRWTSYEGAKQTVKVRAPRRYEDLAIEPDLQSILEKNDEILQKAAARLNKTKE
jgi:hypothetical protein